MGTRLRFGPASEFVHLFSSADGTRDLDELTTPEDHEAAADFIMRTLRGFTEDPRTRVVASIAGGRKTMSAPLTSCMILLGRAQDRICHVLVNPPFDSPSLSPLFLFPEPGRVHRLSERGREFPSEAARVDLLDVPFVRVRGWYEHEHCRVPPSYMALVHEIQGLVPKSADFPLIELGQRRAQVRVNGKEVATSASEFALLLTVVHMHLGQQVWRDWSTIGAIARACWSWFERENLVPREEWKIRFFKQLELFPKIAWQVVPWPKDSVQGTLEAFGRLDSHGTG